MHRSLVRLPPIPARTDTVAQPKPEPARRMVLGVALRPLAPKSAMLWAQVTVPVQLPRDSRATLLPRVAVQRSPGRLSNVLVVLMANGREIPLHASRSVTLSAMAAGPLASLQASMGIKGRTAVPQPTPALHRPALASQAAYGVAMAHLAQRFATAFLPLAVSTLFRPA